MATYLTPAYQGSPYVSGIPIDLVMQAMATKEARYQRTVSDVQGQLDRLSNYNIIKDSDKMVIGDKLNQLVGKLNSYSGSNLTDENVYNELMGATSQFYNDPEVYKRIAANANASNQVKRYQDLIEKKPDAYGASNEHVFLKQLQSWKDNPDQIEFKGTYVPYHNIDKEANEIIDTVLKNPDIVREAEYTLDASGKPVKRGEREVKQVMAERIQEALMSRLSGNARNQMLIDYEAGLDSPANSLPNVLREIKDRSDAYGAQINDYRNDLNSGKVGDDLYAATNRRLNAVIAAKKRTDEIYNQVSSTGDITHYYNPNNFIKNRLFGMADSYAHKHRFSSSSYSK